MVDGRRDVVDAHDPGPLLGRHAEGGERGRQALGGRRPVIAPSTYLREIAASSGAAELVAQPTEGAQDGDRLRGALGEVGARVDDELLLGDPAVAGHGAALAQEGHDVADHVAAVVREPRLLRRRAGVHDHEGGARRRGDVGQPGVAQARDVVDEHGARRHRRAGHRGLVGVHGHRDALRGQAAHEGDDPVALHVLGRRAGVRHARLAADVDEVRALGHEPACVRDLRVEGRVPHRVGERVRARVDDAHDQRVPGPQLDHPVAEPQRPRAHGRRR